MIFGNLECYRISGLLTVKIFQAILSKCRSFLYTGCVCCMVGISCLLGKLACSGRWDEKSYKVKVLVATFSFYIIIT